MSWRRAWRARSVCSRSTVAPGSRSNDRDTARRRRQANCLTVKKRPARRTGVEADDDRSVLGFGSRHEICGGWSSPRSAASTRAPAVTHHPCSASTSAAGGSDRQPRAVRWPCRIPRHSQSIRRGSASMSICSRAGARTWVSNTGYRCTPLRARASAVRRSCLLIAASDEPGAHGLKFAPGSSCSG